MTFSQYFTGQHKNECFIFYSYRHWIGLFVKIYFNLFILILAITIFVIWIKFDIDKDQSVMSFLSQNSSMFIIFYTWFLFHVHHFFTDLLDFMLDIIIVTDCRFIEIKRTIFFKEDFESIDLAKIQDVQFHKSDFFSAIFDFGSLNVTFASILDIKIIQYVPMPDKFVEHLNKLKRRLIYKYEGMETEIKGNHPRFLEEMDEDNVVDDEEVVI